MTQKTNEEIGMRTALISSVCNVFLAGGKTIAGILGNSTALIADGIESTLDIISSIIVWGGLKLAAEPPDSNHPYGHGKAESLAGIIVSLILLGVGFGVIYHGFSGIINPDDKIPKQFTLYVLVAIIAIKELLFQYTKKIGESINSSSMKAEAWHHRSDAITSLAALVGVYIAINWEYKAADEYAAIIAGFIILFNGTRIFLSSTNEIMDKAPSEKLIHEVQIIAKKHPEVKTVSNCRIRKSGLKLLLDIDIQVEPDITVKDGHDIAHEIERILLQEKSLNIIDVIVHVEPFHPHD